MQIHIQVLRNKAEEERRARQRYTFISFQLSLLETNPQ